MQKTSSNIWEKTPVVQPRAQDELKPTFISGTEIFPIPMYVTFCRSKDLPNNVSKSTEAGSGKD